MIWMKLNWSQLLQMTSTDLNEAAKDGFHSLAYELTRLAKRARPETLPTTDPNKKSLKKRVIVYVV